MRYICLILIIITTSCKSSKISNKSSGNASHTVPAGCGVDCMAQNELLKSFENIFYTKIDSSQLQIGINFFIVNREIESQLPTIQTNLLELNSLFEGSIEFRKHKVIRLESKYKLPTVYQDYLDGGQLFDELSREVAELGYINVFVMETLEETPGRKLHGFTPLYNDYHEGYAKVAPEMDRLMVSFEGLEFKYSLYHELGHYFSLAHPWELSEAQKLVLGLQDPQEECVNHMNYNCFVNKFTQQQLIQMKAFANRYRSYLGIRGAD